VEGRNGRGEGLRWALTADVRRRPMQGGGNLGASVRGRALAKPLWARFDHAGWITQNREAKTEKAENENLGNSRIVATVTMPGCLHLSWVILGGIQDIVAWSRLRRNMG
jgi:hypothetical protein